MTRHYDELLERELGLLADEEILERDGLLSDDEIYARDFDDEYELMQREYDELVAREPGLGDWFRNLFKSKKQREEEKKKKAEKKKAEEEKKAAEAAKADESSYVLFLFVYSLLCFIDLVFSVLLLRPANTTISMMSLTEVYFNDCRCLSTDYM